MPNNQFPCHSCGKATHIDLLDAKPEAGENPDTVDWTRLECFDCYGAGWLPAVTSALAMLTPSQRLVFAARGGST